MNNNGSQSAVAVLKTTNLRPVQATVGLTVLVSAVLVLILAVSVVVLVLDCYVAFLVHYLLLRLPNAC